MPFLTVYVGTIVMVSVAVCLAGYSFWLLWNDTEIYLVGEGVPFAAEMEEEKSEAQCKEENLKTGPSPKPKRCRSPKSVPAKKDPLVIFENPFLTPTHSPAHKHWATVAEMCV